MWWAALGLILIGCANAANRKPRGSFVFQVERDSELWEPANDAAHAWSAATGLDVRVSEEEGVPIFFVEHLSDCNEAGGDQACSFRSRIEVLSDTPRSILRQLLTHEIGHQLRGDGEHMDDPDAMMSSPTRAKSVTPSDVYFVCQRAPCR